MAARSTATAMAPVLRVVYDGSPEAGKTTSLLVMATELRQLVVVPEEEGSGRTVYFDWFENQVESPTGESYRLQVISVPGQARWAARRAHLVTLAHVVIFVADTRRASWPGTVERWESLLTARAQGRESVVPIVFQANKRDCADLVPLDEMRAVVPETIPIIESSAALEMGVQEAFWEAVRLGSSRASIPVPPTQADLLDGPEDLLERLVHLDATTAQLSSQASAVRNGFVWPPVEGHALLREALGARADLREGESGTYGLGPTWRIFSPRDAQFRTLEESRSALLEWARVHGRLAEALSPRRCIVVLETTGGTFRLWELVHRAPTLRELLADQEPFGGALTFAARLVLAALLVRRVHHQAEVLGFGLPCTLDSIGWAEHGAQFVGLMPYPLPSSRPLSVHELGWQLETFLVPDGEEAQRSELAAVVASHPDEAERDFLRAVFGT